MTNAMTEEKIEEFIREIYKDRPDSLDKILNAKEISEVGWGSFLYIAVSDFVEVDIKLNPSRWQHKPKK